MGHAQEIRRTYYKRSCGLLQHFAVRGFSIPNVGRLGGSTSRRSLAVSGWGVFYRATVGRLEARHV